MIRYVSPKGRIGKIVQEQEAPEQSINAGGGSSFGVSPKVRTGSVRSIQNKKSTRMSRKIERSVRNDVRHKVNKYVKINNRLAADGKERQDNSMMVTSIGAAKNSAGKHAPSGGGDYVSAAAAKAAGGESYRLEREALANSKRQPATTTKGSSGSSGSAGGTGGTKRSAFKIREDAGKLISTKAGRAAGGAALTYQKKVNAGMIQANRKIKGSVNQHAADAQKVTKAVTETVMRADTDDAMINKAWDTTVSVTTGAGIKTVSTTSAKVRVVSANRKIKRSAAKELQQGKVNAKSASTKRKSSKASAKKKPAAKSGIKGKLKSPVRLGGKFLGVGGKGVMGVGGKIGQTVQSSVEGASIGETIAAGIETTISRIMLPAMLILMIMAVFGTMGSLKLDLDTVKNAAPTAPQQSSQYSQTYSFDKDKKLSDDATATKLVYNLVNEAGMDRYHASYILTALQYEDELESFISLAEEDGGSYLSMLDGCVPAVNEDGQIIYSTSGEPVMVETHGYTPGIWTTDNYRDFCQQSNANAVLIFEEYYFGRILEKNTDKYNDIMVILVQNMYMVKEWDGNLVIETEATAE